jgi:hypothetical protein
MLLRMPATCNRNSSRCGGSCPTNQHHVIQVDRPSALVRVSRNSICDPVRSPALVRVSRTSIRLPLAALLLYFLHLLLLLLHLLKPFLPFGFCLRLLAVLLHLQKDLVVIDYIILDHELEY